MKDKSIKSTMKSWIMLSEKGIYAGTGAARPAGKG